MHWMLEGIKAASRGVHGRQWIILYYVFFAVFFQLKVQIQVKVSLFHVTLNKNERMQIKMLYMIHSRFNFIIMIVNVNF